MILPDVVSIAAQGLFRETRRPAKNVSNWGDTLHHVAQGCSITEKQQHDTQRPWKPTSPARRGAGRPVLLRDLSDLLVKRGHHFEKVADHAVVRLLEDRGLGILVDCNDHLRGTHACEVLNRS